MTREEEILEMASKYTANETNGLNAGLSSERKGVLFAAFRDGAAWADETMINKVCEWLESLSGYVVCGQKANVSNFRKAMKGGEQ